MNIDVIGAPFDDDESIENWQEDEVERRMRKGSDPTFDYMNRDPRNPERYPIGSGGEVNYGIRMRETVNPAHTTGETIMGVRSGGTRARLHADMTRAPNLPARLAYGYEEQDDNMTLASLGFIGHSGMGDDDAVYGAEAMKVMTVSPTMLGDLDGLDFIGSDDYGYIDAVAADFVDTFLTSRFDGLAPRPAVMTQIGYLCGEYQVGDIGKALLPKIKLPNVGKAVGGALKAAGGAVAKAGTAVIKGLSDSYKKLASAVDINKGKKNQMIADCNQIKGSIAGMKARNCKSPKSKAKIAALEAQYATLAKEAAQHKIKCEETEKMQLDTKAAGVATAVGIAAKAKYVATPAGAAATKTATQATLASKGTTGLSDADIAMDYLGIEPTIAAIAISGIAIAVAVGLALSKFLGKSGKLKTDCKSTETELNKLEEDWTAGEKVPYNPATQPYSEVITDPATGKVLGVRAGDTLKMSKDTDTRELTKAKETATQQSGAASFTVDPETGMVTGGKTGEVATTAAKAELVEAKAAAEQGTLLGKLGIGKVPWYAWVGIAAAGGAVIYVLAMKGKKKKAVTPPQPGAV